MKETLAARLTIAEDNKRVSELASSLTEETFELDSKGIPKHLKKKDERK
jgi:hypothetical protein